MSDVVHNTDLDLTVIDDLDFEPPCECGPVFHERFGKGKVVALVKLDYPCCEKKCNFLVCEGCLIAMTAQKLRGICATCGGEWSHYNSIVREVKYL